MHRWIVVIMAVAGLIATAFAAETEVRVGLDGRKAQAFFDEMTGKGWRYTHVDSVAANDGLRYTMVFTHEAPPQYITRSGLDAATFQSASDEAKSQGMRLVDLSVADSDGGGTFAAIWEKGDDRSSVVRTGLTHEDLQSLLKEQSAAGFRPTLIDTYRSGKETLFAAVFEKRNGPDWNVGIELSPDDSQAKFADMAKQGYRPVRIRVCNTVDGLRYTEIFERSNNGEWASKSGIDADRFIALTEANKTKGMSLADVSAYNDGESINYAAIWSK